MLKVFWNSNLRQPHACDLCRASHPKTLKEQIDVRKSALGYKDWTGYLPDVLGQHNPTSRVTTRVAPEEAIKTKQCG